MKLGEPQSPFTPYMRPMASMPKTAGAPTIVVNAPTLTPQNAPRLGCPSVDGLGQVSFGADPALTGMPLWKKLMLVTLGLGALAGIFFIGKRTTRIRYL
jgi:hypothetical protein